MTQAFVFASIACLGIFCGKSAGAQTGQVSIMAYGAHCDGVTDDSAAWRAAFKAAETLTLGGMVTMPSCTSYIASTVAVTLPSNVLVGIQGLASDMSRILVAPGQDGFNFTYSSQGNYLMSPAATGTALKLSSFTIVRDDSSSAGKNKGISVSSDTVAGQQQPATTVNDVVFGGIAKGTGWLQGLSFTDITNLSLSRIRYYGGSTGTGVTISAGAVGSSSFSVDTHINDYFCEQAYACVSLVGQVQGTFVNNFTWAAVTYGLIASGASGASGQAQNLISLNLGHIAASADGIELIDTPFFSISNILFLATDYSARSASVGVDVVGGYSGTITGNNFYMTQNGSSQCARLRSGAYRVVMTGNTCDNTETGISIEDTSADNTIVGNSFNDNALTPILDNGRANEIEANNISGVSTMSSGMVASGSLGVTGSTTLSGTTTISSLGLTGTTTVNGPFLGGALGSLPIVSCGTGGSVHGSALRGYGQFGTGTVQQCSFTLPGSFPGVPICTVSSTGYAAGTLGLLPTMVGSGTITVVAQAPAPGQNFTYVCVQ